MHTPNLAPVLIRGACGFLGEHVARTFVRQGIPVRLFIRSATRLAADLRLAPNVEVMEGDALDGKAVASSLTAVDTVLDLIGGTVPAMPNASLELEVDKNLMPLAILLRAMADVGARRIIYPSSGGTIYGRRAEVPSVESSPMDPSSCYAMGRFLAERMIQFQAKDRGIGYVILRIGNPFGRTRPREIPQGVVDIFIRRHWCRQQVEIWGNGTQVRDYVFIADVVSAFEAVMKSSLSGEIFNVGTGTGHSVNDIVSTIEEVSGRSVARCERPSAFSGVDRNILSYHKLSQATGWYPQYTLKAGVSLLWHQLSN